MCVMFTFNALAVAGSVECPTIEAMVAAPWGELAGGNGSWQFGFKNNENFGTAVKWNLRAASLPIYAENETAAMELFTKKLAAVVLAGSNPPSEPERICSYITNTGDFLVYTTTSGVVTNSK